MCDHRQSNEEISSLKQQCSKTVQKSHLNLHLYKFVGNKNHFINELLIKDL